MSAKCDHSPTTDPQDARLTCRVSVDGCPCLALALASRGGMRAEVEPTTTTTFQGAVIVVDVVLQGGEIDPLATAFGLKAQRRSVPQSK